MSFDDFGLAPNLLRAVTAEGYTTPTPIQTQAIPHILQGHDLLGCAQTGTGKTAAFALPLLHLLNLAEKPATNAQRKIRLLVLAPTRELAAQIGESFGAYGRHTGLRHAVIFGGVNQNSQTRALRARVDILVATPGRLMDLMNQGYVDLSHVQMFVLDEADRMLDMGFIHDIRTVVKELPARRQTMLFSATMPDDIRKLANTVLRDPVSIQVAAVSAPAEKVHQSVYLVDKCNKSELLAHLFQHCAMSRALVFTRTKHGADRVVRDLQKAGIQAEAIHGNKSQAARQRALAKFKSARPPVLVATDIAARGLDIDEISHVVNYDLPNIAETYVHRIGRTARAGAEGIAVSFCDRDERAHLKAIERLMRKTVLIETDHPIYAARPAKSASTESRETSEPRESFGHNRPPRKSSAGPKRFGRRHAANRAGADKGKPRRATVSGR